MIYFSLSLKTLSIPGGLSNRKRKEIDSFNAKMHGAPIRKVPCYLIGQLAKNSAITKEKTSPWGKRNHWLCDFGYIMASVKSIGGRYVMIECYDNEKLKSFYSDNSFDEITTVPYEKIPMFQMIRKLVDE